MIVGQNALLNQYVPTFFIKDLLDGQILKYDSTRRAFVNATGSGGSGASRLGELDDVSPSVDNPLSLQNGQALVYNSFTSLWENKFIDYNTLINVPSTTITLTGDVTGSGTSPVATTLATVNLSPGTYGDAHYVPTITVNSKGLVTLVTTQHVDTSVRDLVPLGETITVSPRHQYIVTGQLDIDGLMINNGVIAIL